MVSIVIPTYKNQRLFLKNLAHNWQYFNGCEVIVVNDDPEQSLKKVLDKYQLTLLENKINLGFGRTVNRGVEIAKNQYIMLINDDVIFEDDRFKSVLPLFKKNPLLFGVGFAQKEKNNNLVGKNRIYWRNGLINHQKADDLKLGFTGWAEGGSCIIDKKKFLELDGFDGLYSPFYWEDIDLSYRAWKTGYQVIFQPKTVVNHHHETTIGKNFDNKFIKTVAYRNQFIFIWKNITDFFLIIKHCFQLPFNLIYYPLKGESEFLSGFINAAKKLPEILQKRDADKGKYHLTDKEVLSKFI